MQFEVFSQLHQKKYRINQDEVQQFYDEHVLGAADERAFRLARWLPSGHKASQFLITGTVLLQVFNPASGLVQVSMGFNTVTTAGKGWVIDRIQTAASTPAIMDYQAIGSGSTASAVGDTALETELARGQGTLSQPTATTDRLVTTFAAGTGTGTVTETGRLNASSSGTLLARQVFSAVTKGSGDSLTVTHDITIS